MLAYTVHGMPPHTTWDVLSGSGLGCGAYSVQVGDFFSLNHKDKRTVEERFEAAGGLRNFIGLGGGLGDGSSGLANEIEADGGEAGQGRLFLLSVHNPLAVADGASTGTPCAGLVGGGEPFMPAFFPPFLPLFLSFWLQPQTTTRPSLRTPAGAPVTCRRCSTWPTCCLLTPWRCSGTRSWRVRLLDFAVGAGVVRGVCVRIVWFDVGFSVAAAAAVQWSRRRRGCGRRSGRPSGRQTWWRQPAAPIRKVLACCCRRV